MMEWISVKDRLPERAIRTGYWDYSKPVLFTDGISVYVGDCFVPQGQPNPRWEGYDVEELADYTDDDLLAEAIENVTHWLPIPETPEESKP